MSDYDHLIGELVSLTVRNEGAYTVGGMLLDVQTDERGNVTFSVFIMLFHRRAETSFFHKFSEDIWAMKRLE